MRIDRLLAITIMMLNRDRVSAKELADHFEVSIRTIYRDIEAMCLAGIPVASFSGNTGGYGIMDNYRLDKRLLTDDDMVALLSTLKGVNRTLEDNNITAVMEKIKSMVPRGKSGDFMKSVEHMIIDIQPWGENPALKKKLSLLKSAISSNHLLEFEYQGGYRRGKTKRIVEPMTLLNKSYAWYLFGYCRLRSDYRFFKLTRMRNIQLLKGTFERREQSYADHLKAFDPPGQEMDIVLKFSSEADAFIEDYFEDAQVKRETDGSIIVYTTLPEQDWIYGWVLSFGDTVELLKPEHLRQEIAEIAEKIRKKYQT
ncbi:MAG: YafY family transcriptional regulator [Acidobacteria bacterium]|nr:YafY family transcriptional regulator [Acidobacteriota bacterium]